MPFTFRKYKNSNSVLRNIEKEKKQKKKTPENASNSSTI